MEYLLVEYCSQQLISPEHMSFDSHRRDGCRSWKGEEYKHELSISIYERDRNTF